MCFFLPNVVSIFENLENYIFLVSVLTSYWTFCKWVLQIAAAFYAEAFENFNSQYSMNKVPKYFSFEAYVKLLLLKTKFANTKTLKCIASWQRSNWTNWIITVQTVYNIKIWNSVTVLENGAFYTTSGKDQFSFISNFQKVIFLEAE